MERLGDLAVRGVCNGMQGSYKEERCSGHLVSILFFFFLFLSALGLHCCARAFSSCGEWGRLLFFAV